MQIFGFPLSPFVRKVLVVAEEKGLSVESVLTNPANPSPDFLAASPMRKIPALKDGDYTLADSTAIATYMDALRPDPPLLPTDPKRRGKAIWFEEFADTLLAAAGGKIMFNRFVSPRFLGRPGDEDAARQGEADLEPLLDYLESVAPAEGWLTGDEFGIADIAAASMLRTLAYVDCGVDAERRPATAAWYARVCARPAWQAVAAREAAVMKSVAG